MSNYDKNELVCIDDLVRGGYVAFRDNPDFMVLFDDAHKIKQAYQKIEKIKYKGKKRWFYLPCMPNR